jgi:putative aldouronate transport system permease protein
MLRLVFVFPISIILALMLNELRLMVFKRTVQTIIYLPFFISIVVVHGIFANLLSTQGGVVNVIIEMFGGNVINFYTNDWFRFVLLLTDAYQGAGWGTIVYLAALAGVDVQLYEASQVDGAGRLRQLFHISLPSIMPIIMLMLILRIGGILNAGTEQILVMYNPTVYATADVLGTLIFREGLGRAQFGFTTAVGMFESIVSFVLLLSANSIASKYFKRGVW